MKDYSLNSNDSKFFIRKYKIKKHRKKPDELIIYFGSGKPYRILYTEENERKIVEKMNKQVLNSEEAEKKLRKHFSNLTKWAIFSVSMLALGFLELVTNFTDWPHVIQLCDLFCLFSGAFYIDKMIDCKLKIRDIKKNRMFVQNEEHINKRVKENPPFLIDASIKTRKSAESNLEKKSEPVFTLNSIDSMSYRELKKILDNIKEYEQFLSLANGENQKEKEYVKK